MLIHTKSLIVLAIAFGALVGCSSKVAAGSDAGTKMSASELSAEGRDERFAWTQHKVVDAHTNLAWQRTADEARFSFAEAKAYCAELSIDGGGFRLPTKDELLTILDGDAEPAPFAGRVDWYWSSTTSDNVDSAAWVVGIASYTNTNALETKSAVRCVKVQ